MAICETCERDFEPSRGAKAGRFCSHRCYWDGMRGERTAGVAHRLVRAPDHPVAPPSGTVAQARITLYDDVGPGPHPCHWCGNEVDWKPGAGIADPTALIVDHLDWDPTNDERSNLVASCNTCNAHRRVDGSSRRIRDEEMFVLRGDRRSRAEERQCESCGTTFLAALVETNKGRGRFCGRSCARRFSMLKRWGSI